MHIEVQQQNTKLKLGIAIRDYSVSVIQVKDQSIILWTKSTFVTVNLVEFLWINQKSKPDYTYNIYM